MLTRQKSPAEVEAFHPLIEEREENERGVTRRVVVLALLLALALGYLIPVIDYKFSNTFLGATHLPPGAVGALLILLLVVNPLLRLLSHQLTFSRNEILTLYLSCLFSALVPGIGGNNYFVSFLIGSFYYATRENHWFDFLKGLPPWFTPALNADGSYNQAIVDAWYTGLQRGQSIPWGAWVVPLAAWGLFFVASFTMMGCLSVMLRAQWGEYEALSFPLLRLPLELTEGVKSSDAGIPRFFRNPLMWVGFGIAASIQLLNGLSLYFPDVPSIATDINTGPLFSEAPWNQIGWVALRIYPIVIGITYLLTSEISFSFWFFYWVMKFQLIAAYSVGFPSATLPRIEGNGDSVFIGYQEVGANLAYAALIFWMARRHLGHIVQRAFGRVPAGAAEWREPLPYPIAFWGFVLGFGVMVAWGVAAGMSLPLSLLLWTGYLIIAVVLSRVVAEGGLLFVHHSWMPLSALGQLIGAGSGTVLSTAHGLVPASFIEFSTIQDFRGSLMPSFVQSFKLARERGIAARPLMVLIAAVIAIGIPMAFTMNVRLGYENGGLGLQSWLATAGPKSLGGNLASISALSQPVTFASWFWLSIGALVTTGIVIARSRLAWFPLHPLGYLMSNTLPLQYFWFSIFVGWTAKTLISRYGGHETYRKTTPLFLGMALGDVAMMLFWLCIDGWQGRMGHQLMPG